MCSKEIKGFYYDEEKKNYFKILPNSNNSITNAITSDKLKIINKERKRQKYLKKNNFSPSSSNINLHKKNLCRLLKDRELNSMINNNKICLSRHLINKSLITNLKLFNKRPIDKIYVDFKISNMIINSDQNKLLFVCKEDFSDTILIKGFENGSENCYNIIQESPYLNLPYEVVSHQQNIRIKNVVFSDTFGIVTHEYKNFNCNNEIHIHGKTPSAGESMVKINGQIHCFSCNEVSKYHLVVGFENKLVLYDINYGNIIKYHSKLNNMGFQVKSTHFSKYHPKTLYFGTLQGGVNILDLRCFKKPIPYSHMLNEDSCPPCSLYECIDPNYLISSHFNGKIVKWDVRLKKVVTEYKGHKNNYKVTPLVFDSNEEFMASVDINGYTRIWDLRSSELLQIIPSPVTVDPFLMNSVIFLPIASNAYQACDQSFGSTVSKNRGLTDFRISSDNQHGFKSLVVVNRAIENKKILSQNNYPGIIISADDTLYFYS